MGTDPKGFRVFARLTRRLEACETRLTRVFPRICHGVRSITWAVTVLSGDGVDGVIRREMVMWSASAGPLPTQGKVVNQRYRTFNDSYALPDA